MATCLKNLILLLTVKFKIKTVMKKLVTIILLDILLKSNLLFAQITLQHILDSTYIGNRFYCTDVGNNDFKYVFLNAVSNSFSLYNMDMTPYLTNIHIPVT